MTLDKFEVWMALSLSKSYCSRCGHVARILTRQQMWTSWAACMSQRKRTTFCVIWACFFIV